MKAVQIHAYTAFCFCRMAKRCQDFVGCQLMAQNDKSWFQGDKSWRKTTCHGGTDFGELSRGVTRITQSSAFSET
jgi:hypothetical protein